MRITIETDESKGEFVKSTLHNDDGDVNNQSVQDGGEARELGSNPDTLTDMKLKAFDTSNAINGGPPDQNLIESIESIESSRSSGDLTNQEKENNRPIDAGKAPDSS